MSIVLKDWQGTEYTDGSRIVYVNGDSSGNTWRPGTVVEIRENPDWDDQYPYYTNQYIVLWQPEEPTPWSKSVKPGRLSNLTKIMAL